MRISNTDRNPDCDYDCNTDCDPNLSTVILATRPDAESGALCHPGRAGHR